MLDLVGISSAARVGPCLNCFTILTFKFEHAGTGTYHHESASLARITRMYHPPTLAYVFAARDHKKMEKKGR